MENKTLLHVLNESTRKEPEYKDFISRMDFVNKTGIFVTPDYFSMVYDSFIESGVSVAEFVTNYEEKYVTSCIVKEELKGTFKYEVLDDCISCMNDYDSMHEPNAWEIIDCLAREVGYLRTERDRYHEQFKEIVSNTHAMLNWRDPNANGEQMVQLLKNLYNELASKLEELSSSEKE